MIPLDCHAFYVEEGSWWLISLCVACVVFFYFIFFFKFRLVQPLNIRRFYRKCGFAAPYSHMVIARWPGLRLPSFRKRVYSLMPSAGSRRRWGLQGWLCLTFSRALLVCVCGFISWIICSSRNARILFIPIVLSWTSHYPKMHTL